MSVTISAFWSASPVGTTTPSKSSVEVVVDWLSSTCMATAARTADEVGNCAVPRADGWQVGRRITVMDRVQTASIVQLIGDAEQNRLPVLWILAQDARRDLPSQKS